MQTDDAWRKWSEAEPYFAVLTDDKYLSTALEDNLEHFFETGKAHVEHIFDVINNHVETSFSPSLALDFGCGVGRIAYPLANKCASVVGIDVAPAMLEQARAHSHRSENSAVNFILTDKMHSLEPASFDLIHSTLVFQHIRPAQGMPIIDQLLKLLSPDGIFVLQIPTQQTLSPLRRSLAFVKRLVPPFAHFTNFVRSYLTGSPHIVAPMEMNIYNLNAIEQVAKAHQVGINLSRSYEADGFEFITLYMRGTNV